MQKMILSLAVLIGSCAVAAAQSPAPPGDAANGYKLFMADGCYQCHGTVGQGSRGTGPRLAPNPMPYENFEVAAAQARQRHAALYGAGGERGAARRHLRLCEQPAGSGESPRTSRSCIRLD